MIENLHMDQDGYGAVCKTAISRFDSGRVLQNMSRWWNWHTHQLEVLGVAGSSPARDTK